MSEEKVLTTPEAKAAIKSLQSIISGGFTGEISKLDAQGKQLSDPNHWDGPLARRFRADTWPGVHSSLQKAKTELEELRGSWTRSRRTSPRPVAERFCWAGGAHG